ncbi:hypothetical protein EMIHUDRAFT_215521 [Emiliania huxleyi CCMP1516]|uniref:ABC transporter domain-containing protein n=4 Tax=Emiliania huxleyi TaxID=2903 RepID=A0A0D3IHI2_EMIH1|nr:hypothetical protein EMIHUDRAFT_215521 [Emiliania huxleyi CCMP1516]EOD10717.1 hypothetical protein EMIHUDRAFT_215521 [Emiliania huxleyi CCMP1516]|eukprot:XP_005763146.1 hypothetical protein EMIHUDRAFT_215521 [Emiliania huxleyi CCMP1516]
MASRSVISLQHLNVTVGSPPRTLVAALSLRIHANERWAVVGANGAGKTVTSSLFARRVIGGADASAAAALAVHVSFDSHRRLLRDEQRAFRESRYEQNVHKRATPASFLFPHLVPEDPEGGTRAARTRSGYKGYRPPRSRLSPLPVRHDASPRDEPLLAALEGATCGGAAGSLLRSFSLLEARHRPLHVLSTGQLRKALLASCLLAPPKLLLLDEALDGLDARSRRAALEAVQTVTTQHDCALVMVAHRTVDLPPSPTHALLLGLGDDGTGWQAGTWDALRSDFRDVTIRYDAASTVFAPPLNWTVREGENWAVVGGNGTGKTTLVDLISGENVLGYTQDISLFGRRKGSGESVWSIKEQLGVISTASHMSYSDFADPEVVALARANGFARSSGCVTTWEVVASGFFDSVGAYKELSLSQREAARGWIDCFGLADLVAPPPAHGGGNLAYLDASHPPEYVAAARRAAELLRPSQAAAAGRDFFRLSFGQQKLVLLCRAVVKRPRLLLLDEPTHGLSSANRHRLLGMLSTLAADPSIALVLVTHRQDEIEQLGFGNEERKDARGGELVQGG